MPSTRKVLALYVYIYIYMYQYYRCVSLYLSALTRAERTHRTGQERILSDVFARLCYPFQHWRRARVEPAFIFRDNIGCVR